MPQEMPPRKRAFNVARARLGLTATEFARQEGVSMTHLYEVLNERRTPGAELDAAINALIARADETAAHAA